MKNITTLVAPVLKWAGGKRQLLKTIVPLLPQNISAYCEPFVGGGALLFNLLPKIAYVNDIAPELINVYHTIKTDVESLIRVLKTFKNTREKFYAIRNWDRSNDPFPYSELSNINKAARTLYLNKTCYNGLYRVNSKGQFNSPFGNYARPNIVNADGLRVVSRYFNSAKVSLTSVDYADVLGTLPKNCFVYLDPPYHPISKTSSFQGYTRNGFSKDEQIRLRENCEDLTLRGIKFMLSQSFSEFTMGLYSSYNITIVEAKRAINSKGNRRGKIPELIIRNY